MDQAIHYWPNLLANLDTFYELACGNQPKGYRDQAEYLDLEANSRHLFMWMEKLFDDGDQEVKGRKDRAYAHAYLALSILNNQVGNQRQARNYLQQAVKLRPRFLRSVPTLASFMKLQAKRLGFG
jgi:tetratricopeptide (TPR) repeat protein